MITKNSLAPEKLKKVFVTSALLWAVVILVLTLFPSMGAPSSIKIRHLDKIVHFALFFVQAFLMAGALQNNRRKNYFIFFSVFLCLSMFGGIIEVVQHFIPKRGFDFLDIASNCGGIIIGTAIFLVLKGKFFPD